MPNQARKIRFLVVTVWVTLSWFVPVPAIGQLRAGAAKIDITPQEFPVLVNGGMFSRSTDKVSSQLHARAIVLDDGTDRIAMVIVDSCMMPGWLLDEAKQRASQLTQLEPERILISATHTHTAPSSFACLGTVADPSYPAFLREQLAASIAAAESRLEPAEIGWAEAQAPELTAIRRWILRPDRMKIDPFGNRTVRASMHVAANLDDVTGPSGPEDPQLGMIAIRSRKGRPLAVLTNFSMHYFSGESGLSADYFGLFCEGLQERIDPAANSEQACLVAMSHGCSGDIWRKDYANPLAATNSIDIRTYAKRMAEIAADIHTSVQFTADADIKMIERRFEMPYRLPSRQRLAWSEQVEQAMGDRDPKTTEEVYAREQRLLADLKGVEVVLQAIRIGDIAIAATPTETYALTGLKIKRHSPFEQTMVIELANGACGYIPPPEQHRLGGYNTWEARSAGLVTEAEPRIVATLQRLLQVVCDRPCEPRPLPLGVGSQTILRTQPLVYWRLDELSGPIANDTSGNGSHGLFEPNVAFYLEGPRNDFFSDHQMVNRCVHLANGRIRVRLPDTGPEFTVSLWCWNGMPNGSRKVLGWLFARGQDYEATDSGMMLGVDGTDPQMSRLRFGDQLGKTPVERWRWHHVVLVQDTTKTHVFLDGVQELELPSYADKIRQEDDWFFGGRADRRDGWEGRLDEIAVFPRALTASEVAKLTTQK